MHLTTVPSVIKPLAGDFVWSIKPPQKEVYLTFDDGPTPGITEEVLALLDEYDARATFFCLGKNAIAHPRLFAELSERGHTIGNHTFSHPNGWKTPTTAYLREVVACRRVVKSTLFRPPYGRITRAQASAVRKQFTLVMWDVLSGDYLQNRSTDQCLRVLQRHTRPGSIVVFHDSEKAAATLLSTLPRYLHWLSEAGYRCSAITSEVLPPEKTRM